MPLSNQKLESLLRKSGCKFSFDTTCERFCARFHTKLFRNSKGESQLDLIVKLVEDGAFIRFLCPEIYSLKDCKFKGAAFQATLQMAWITKALSYEFDSESENLWAVIDLPLEDGTLTAQQVERILQMMVDLVDEYHPVIHHAIVSGEINLRLAGTATTETPVPTEVEALVAKLGGIDKVRKLAQESGAA